MSQTLQNPSFMEWVEHAHNNGAHFTMADPESKSPVDWTGAYVSYSDKQKLGHIRGYFNSGMPLGLIPQSAGLLCLDFDFDKAIPLDKAPKADALLAALDEWKIRYFIEPSRTPGRLHIWVFVDKGFTKPKFTHVEFDGVKYEARWNSAHTIIWNHDEFLYGLLNPRGSERLDIPRFNALFHIAADRPAYDRARGREDVYESGRQWVYKEELLQALIAFGQDDAGRKKSNGEYLVVENPIDTSENRTNRLSVHRETGAAHDFKLETMYSPVQLAEAVGVAVHRNRGGRPKNEPPENQIVVSGKSLSGLAEALGELDIDVRLNVRGGGPRVQARKKEWQRFDDAAMMRMLETIAGKFCYKRTDSKFADLRFGRTSLMALFGPTSMTSASTLLSNTWRAFLSGTEYTAPRMYCKLA